ncbi:WNT1-inducible-signaling pathway protein 1-like isoform X2 [Salmo trutta]|uniref:WNT1-inducible-signaling pathway protein 1-like isoform X2 n=1 Tax=Salmo trutta TaxID=8032 RepID=UPI00113280AE|nr:WNT1-inducible-signaling pathway protein 1-like isoform X2 [Salmo trutta]
MSWLLKWILIAAGIQQAYSQTQNSSAMLPLAESTDLEPYNRTQYCHWPCECSLVPPSCPSGVSLLMDGCDCCRACARQVGEECNEADACDYHKGLYCDYSSDKPRYEKGVCAYSQPPRVWCQNSRRVKIPGRCCEQWICDEPKKGRKTAPRHAVEVVPVEAKGRSRNCVIQTTSWSICSKTCGRGLSLRVSNANDRCEMVKESRLCNIRPCEVDITKHIKPGKNCMNIYREEQPKNFTISGCVSKKSYRPKYCGVCVATDHRCCIPYKSKTIDVEFVCPNGAVFTWQVMWINACFCNLSCKNPNDIFAELENYYGYPEIVN